MIIIYTSLDFEMCCIRVKIGRTLLYSKNADRVLEIAENIQWQFYLRP